MFHEIFVFTHFGYSKKSTYLFSGVNAFKIACVAAKWTVLEIRDQWLEIRKGEGHPDSHREAKGRPFFVAARMFTRYSFLHILHTRKNQLTDCQAFTYLKLPVPLRSERYRFVQSCSRLSFEPVFFLAAVRRERFFPFASIFCSKNHGFHVLTMIFIKNWLSIN